MQQEADLKRLNESMDIKNKKIMQLESQVGIATTYLAGSNITASSSQPGSSALFEQHLIKLCESIKELLSRLSNLPDLFSKSQTVNVYNGNQRSSTGEKSSQTLPVILQGDEAMLADAKDALVAHDDPLTTEEPLISLENILTCTICDKTLQNQAELNHHLESNHANDNVLNNTNEGNIPSSSILISTVSSAPSNPSSL